MRITFIQRSIAIARRLDPWSRGALSTNHIARRLDPARSIFKSQTIFKCQALALRRLKMDVVHLEIVRWTRQRSIDCPYNTDACEVGTCKQRDNTVSEWVLFRAAYNDDEGPKWHNWCRHFLKHFRPTRPEAAELETWVRLESVFCWLATCLGLARYNSRLDLRLDVEELRLTWDLSLITRDLTAPIRVCNCFRGYRRITYIYTKQLASPISIFSY